jgi:sugar O-acyltransferase (sialic acid O-acetyltransferase NeuD family)
MSMAKTEKLLVIGDGAFAEVAYEYFTEDSKYEVVGFAVESEFRTKDYLFDLPVVHLDEASSRFPPKDHSAFVAITYNDLNRLRARLVEAVRELNYPLASFISSNAQVSKSVQISEHCFIFENNVVQPQAAIKDNVIIWSGNHIGHHSTIEKNCFISSHAVISGFCHIGENSFLGVNSTIANNIKVADDNWIGPGVVITQDTQAGELYSLPKATPAKVSSLRFFRVKE